MNQINVVTIGKLIEAHRDGDEQKFKTYVDFIVKAYEEQENDRAARIIRSSYTGDYGAFVEFSRVQAYMRRLKIKEGQVYRIEDPRYAEHVKYLWLTADDDSDVKVYDQKRSVEYADYKPGMLYVSVYEVFPAEADK